MASLALGVKFNPTLGGTTDWVYSSAVAGYVGPAATSPPMVDGKIYRYRAESADLSQWEFGYGVYTASTQTLARTTIQLSSTGAKVAFTVPPQVGVTAFPTDLLLADNNLADVGNAATALANLGVAAAGTPYAPTMTGGGTWSTAGRYWAVGKIYYVSVALTLSSASGASGIPSFSPPNSITAKSPASCFVRENNVGAGYGGWVAAGGVAVSFATLTNGAPTFASGNLYIASIEVEAN
jgi:hypothetical protein